MRIYFFIIFNLINSINSYSQLSVDCPPMVIISTTPSAINNTISICYGDTLYVDLQFGTAPNVSAVDDCINNNKYSIFIGDPLNPFYAIYTFKYWYNDLKGSNAVNSTFYAKVKLITPTTPNNRTLYRLAFFQFPYTGGNHFIIKEYIKMCPPNGIEENSLELKKDVRYFDFLGNEIKPIKNQVIIEKIGISRRKVIFTD